uniref:Gustatory receptor n=1 Tax=Anopheles maculatus TaxID=74869 RepID=A0A182T0M9_9DIPT
MLITNGLNVASFEKLAELLGRIERAIAAWMTVQQRGCSDPPYRLLALLSLLLCFVYHFYVFYRSFLPAVHLVLQVRWELLIVDLYLFHVMILLFALGQCAARLRWMCGDALERDSVAEFCAVLRLRDELIQCVGLVNRIHAVLFLGVSASWLISVTCIVYFDFIYSNLEFKPNHPFVFEHLLMVGWKSALVAGLLAVAGAAAEQVKQITQLTQHCGITSLRNKRLASMVNKLLIKCQFQDIHFTVCGLFTIDNSLNYMVISSVVTYLVIITQFRQMEIENENKVSGKVEHF